MKQLFLVLTSCLLLACNGANRDQAVYNGRLEADIVRISAEAAGKVVELNADEGQVVKAEQVLGRIDTEKLALQLEQQQAQLAEIEINRQALKAQQVELNAQLDLAQSTLKKTEAMASNGAATTQKLDELNTQTKVLEAKKSALQVQFKALDNKYEQIKIGIRRTKLLLNDARITAPLTGTILNRFVNVGELAAPGMTLFEIADLNHLKANIYIPLNKISQIKLDQGVEVLVDGKEQPFKGRVTWISSESEFTPKTILTEETRTTLVYRVKIEVENEQGFLKIGMPVDVVLKEAEQNQ